MMRSKRIGVHHRPWWYDQSWKNFKILTAKTAPAPTINQKLNQKTTKNTTNTSCQPRPAAQTAQTCCGQVCLGYLLEQSVTWLEPEDDDDDLHSPKHSVQHPEEEGEVPAVWACWGGRGALGGMKKAMLLTQKVHDEDLQVV